MRESLTERGFRVAAEYQYGANLRKVRFEHKSQQQPGKNRPEKTFRWEHLLGKVWYSGDGGMPKPLYVNRVFRERDQVETAVGFEGEAKADMAAEFGLAAFSFKDLTPEQATTVIGCDTVLWPDNDDSGAQQAANAARTIAEAAQVRSIKIVSPPPELPPAGDIIDAVKILGWDGARIEQVLSTAHDYSRSGATGSSITLGGADFSSISAEELAGTFPFTVSDQGILFNKERPDGSMDAIRLAARVDVIAQTRDDAGANWGRLLRWRDAEDRWHQWAMPMDVLASDAAAVRARLLSEGLTFLTSNARYRERFSEYLQGAPVQRRIRCVTRIGWSGGAYVLPSQTIGPDGCEEILYQHRHEATHLWKVSGTAEQWRDQVGRLCAGNSRLILAVSCAFAGPLLKLVGAESGGVHLHGLTSTGKSTALIVGGSVCGGGGRNGFTQTWRTTINGLESIAEAHNDGTLFLDELAQVDSREASETAYLLGNGQGKGRMTRSMTAQERRTWTLLYVSAGELTLAEHAASAGRRIKGGAEVRLLNVEADAGAGLGLFEQLHGVDSADAFARRLKEAAQLYYGAPLCAFLERLVPVRPDVERRIRSARENFIRQYVPADSVGEVRRAADRFALIGAAGELATEWSLTGWRDGEATETSRRCFEEWLQRRGTSGPSDVELGIRQIRAFLGTHGTSRFQMMGHASSDDAEESQIVRERVGFRRRSPENGEIEYLIFPEAFQAEVCKDHDSKQLAKELDKRGFLLRQRPSMKIKPRLPGLGPMWVYGIRAAILEGEEC